MIKEYSRTLIKFINNDDHVITDFYKDIISDIDYSYDDKINEPPFYFVPKRYKIIYNCKECIAYGLIYPFEICYFLCGNEYHIKDHNKVNNFLLKEQHEDYIDKMRFLILRRNNDYNIFLKLKLKYKS